MATKPKSPPPRARGEKREGRRALIATGIVQGKSVSAIAGELGHSREWTSRELNDPETQGLIRGLMKPHHERLKRIVDRSISNVERALEMDEQARLKRIEWLTDRIDRMRQVITERAQACKEFAVPGAGTGVLCATEEGYEVDTGLLKELREHEKQLRDELNDLTPNLKAVERARELLEMAEGKHKDGDTGRNDLRFSGTLDELLVMYRQITTAD